MASNHTKTVRQYDDVFLDCRDLRHPWKVIAYYRKDGDVRRTLECTRCGTQRSDRWKRSGERVPGSYNYAAGYQVEGGFDTYEVRIEVMRRAEIYPSEQAMIDALVAAGTPRVRRTR